MWLNQYFDDQNTEKYINVINIIRAPNIINIFFNIIIKGFLIARPLLAQHSVGMVKIKLLINDMYLINLFSGLVQNENIATLIY